MLFPDSFMDELVAKNPIDDVVSQYVALTKKGSNSFGLCPFHSEKTGSFSVNPGKGIYYCFGCHKGGGVINFVMEIESLDFPDAVRFLAKRAGMEVPENDADKSAFKRQEFLRQLCKDAARYYHGKLSQPCGKEAMAYLGKRQVSAAMITRFGLGYSENSWDGLVNAMQKLGYEKKDLLDAGLALVSKEKGTVYDRFRNRLMFPIIDVRGNVIGFGGRVMDDSEPKYLNSPETVIFNKRRNLFGLNLSKKTKQSCLILTEGYMDTMSLHQYGFDCAVASLGTALTEEQAQLMAKYTQQVVLTYDGDTAGQNATKRAIPILERAGLQVKVLQMRGAKDPDEFLKKYGADRFRMMLEGSENQMEYRLRTLQGDYNMNVDEERVAYLEKAAQFIATLPSAIQREVYCLRVSETAGITADAMKLEVNKAWKRYNAAKKKKEEKQLLSPVQQQKPRVREISYDNMRSALAEEGVLQMLLRNGDCFTVAEQLAPEEFSCELLGRAFGLLRERWKNGGTVSLAVLTEVFTPSEMEHLTAVAQKNDTASVQEETLKDYISVIREENGKKNARDQKDLMELRNRMLQKKGVF